MADTPLVAIITPVYNGSPWLERTMACVQAQTYANLVHVILDNASTDDTPQVIERFRGGRTRLIIARNPETIHQAANWSAAFKLTPPEAKYVLLLCADDLIRADAIEKFVARAEEDSEITLVTAMDVAQDSVRAPLPPRRKLIVDGRDQIRAVLDNTFTYYAWQCFFARWRPEYALVENFSDDRAAIDIDFVMSLMERGKVGFVLEPLIYTRRHAAMMSAQFATARNPRVRLWRWEAALKYAHKVFPPEKAGRVIRREKIYMLRFSIVFDLSGAPRSAQLLNDRMRDAGYRVRAWDYVYAILTYPIYRIQQWSLLLRANAGRPRRMSENEFLRSAPGNTPVVKVRDVGDATFGDLSQKALE